MAEVVLDSDRALTYVLLHGDWPEMGWDCTWLSDDEACRMLDFLRQAIPNTLGYDLVAELERRLAHVEDGPPCSPA